jgi:hypothetical protein
MLELLAAIQSVEPPSLVLWGLALFAAGMYPVGFMLGGSCSACCGQIPPCDACTEGSLPDTLTVTFNGFTDQTPGPDLISLGFSSCFGGGASARVTAPGGDPDTNKGPISAVSLTSGGSGYAKLGRVAPTLTISGGTGTGATFTPTLTSTNDACGIPSWSLTSVAFKGGTGYVDGESLTITAADGDTEAQAAVAVVRTARTQPTLTASVDGGSGAVLAVSTSANYGTPETWGVSGVSVTSGGTGYMDGAAVTFSGGADLVAVESAQAVVRTGREEPIVGVGITGTGSGADFSTTITETLDYSTSPARPAWTVSGVTITDGGSGYSVYDMLTASTNGQQSQYSWFYVYVSEVDEDGAITAVEIYGGGLFYKSTGVIDSVEISYGGSYYGGVITAVDVTAPGQYYSEDAEATPYVAEVTVAVASQSPPSDGTGATFTATVEDDPESPDFGKVTALTIDDGGDYYLAWQWRNTKCCGDYYNGLSVVLQRSGCLYSHNMCGVGNIRGGVGRITLEYFGPSVAPVIRLLSEAFVTEVSVACNAVLEAGSNVADCGDWSGVSFSGSGGITATVETGGEYDQTFRNPGGRSCFICCKGSGPVPDEIEADITDNAGGSLSGVYVFPYNPFIVGGVGSFGIAIAWGVPNYVPGFPLVFVAKLGLCGHDIQTNQGFSGECDQCHKKCMVEIALNTLNSGLGDDYFTNDTFPSSDCGGCEPTPICGPYGTYTLTSPNGPGSFTVSMS